MYYCLVSLSGVHGVHHLRKHRYVVNVMLITSHSHGLLKKAIKPQSCIHGIHWIHACITMIIAQEILDKCQFGVFDDHQYR